MCIRDRPVDNMEYIKLNGEKISKEYFRNLKAAEASFNMVKIDGVWKVDSKSINSIGSFNSSDIGNPRSPNGHLHSFAEELYGKSLSYKQYGQKEIPVGEIGKSYFPSRDDLDQAFLENKRSGTIFNVAVSLNGIYFYNANYGFDFHR